MRRDSHEANRLSWNAATRAHNRHKEDQAGFLRAGGTTLFPEEVDLLGPLDGKSLLHLQCNSGQDTLSLVRLGARATGVDISDEAIDFAKQLSAESQIAAEFVRADVYDFLCASEARFDVVFSSYGAWGWLSDLHSWARGIRRVLKPNGRFVIVDFHPTAVIFDEKYTHKWPYSSHGQPLTMVSGVRDYVGPALAPSGFQPTEAFENPHLSHEFAWGLGDLVTAVIEAGLSLSTLREFAYSNGCLLFDQMKELPGRRFTVPDGVPELPLMFGLAARRVV
jgi:SAM-dependent methyltransferase